MAFQQPVVNPSIPLSMAFSGNPGEEKMVVIKGQVLDAAKRFSVDLSCHNGDIAFHFNPRFDEGQVVVCNTKQNGSWGPEVRPSSMPFQLGTQFKMNINIKNQCYQVSVNGNHFLEYEHRILPLHTVQILEINGDISVNHVSFCTLSTPDGYFPSSLSPISWWKLICNAVTGGYSRAPQERSLWLSGGANALRVGISQKY